MMICGWKALTTGRIAALSARSQGPVGHTRRQRDIDR